jgi:chromosome segregation ATPase
MALPKYRLARARPVDDNASEGKFHGQCKGIRAPRAAGADGDRRRWLVAAYFWAQAVGLRADDEEAQRRWEVARAGLVSELQAMQQSVGSAAELRKQLDEGRKALDDAVSQRTTAQSELAHVARQIDEIELGLATEGDQLESKMALLKDVNANLATAQTELADLSTQKAALADEVTKAQTALAEAQARARAADAGAVAAKTTESESRAKSEDLGRTIVALQAQIDALQAKLKPPGAP